MEIIINSIYLSIVITSGILILSNFDFYFFGIDSPKRMNILEERKFEVEVKEINFEGENYKY